MSDPAVVPVSWKLRLSNPFAITVTTATIGLVLRLLHVAYTARMVVMGDSLGFEIHARNFVATWQSIGSGQFWSRLLDTIDQGSLQGVTYPAVQSLVYLVAGTGAHVPLAIVQCVFGAITIGLASATAWRMAGPFAGWITGFVTAWYAPLILTSGLVIAESSLICIQTVSIWCIVEALERPARSNPRRHISIWGATGGFFLGLLMLRPALQFTALILFVTALTGIAIQHVLMRSGNAPTLSSQVPTTRAWGTIAAVALGILVVAAPWFLTNALAFGNPVWSRTGNSWQQVYWGIHPPDRAWQPQDAPVPPKYGVESLPEAWNAGLRIQVRDLDYLDAAIDQFIQTPVQVAATMTNKLAGAWNYPWNPFAENAPVASSLMPALHHLLIAGSVIGLGTVWRRPVTGMVLAGALLATWLPFLAVNIDVRYEVTPAPVGAVLAGIAMSDLVAGVVAVAKRRPELRRHRRMILATVGTIGATTAIGIIGTTGFLLMDPTGIILPVTAHLLTGWAAAISTGLLSTLALVIMSRGRSQSSIDAQSSQPKMPEPRTWMGWAAGAAMGTGIATLMAIQVWFAPEWHEWSIDLRPGDRAIQTINLPADRQIPPDAIVEMRLWLQGGRSPRYEPVIRINGKEVANFRPAFDDAGSLRFPESTLAYARLQGKVRADLPQWYAIRLDPALVDAPRLEVELEASPTGDVSNRDPADAWIRVWGDFPPSGPRIAADRIDPAPAGVFEGPALYSRRAGADNSVFRYYATGSTLIWRRTPLSSTSTTAFIRRAGDRSTGMLDAAKVRNGALRIRFLVLDRNYGLITAF